jgi:hypothetical protein
LLRAELLRLRVFDRVRDLVVGAVNFHVLVIGYRSGQAEDVLAAIGVEAVKENGIRRTVFAGQLQFRIADYHLAFVGYA